MAGAVKEVKIATEYIENMSTGEDALKYSEETAAMRGALILEEESRLSLWCTAKLHWRALMICSVSFTAGMAFGYDTIANGASISMPAFFMYFGALGPTGYYLPSTWTALWTAMSALMQATGAFSVGFLLDRVGRKWPASASGFLTMTGTAIQYTCHGRVQLLIGKMVTGVGIGAAMACATSYASEVAPVKLRGPVQSALVLFTVFMQGLALGIIRIFVPDIKEQAFRTVFAIQWPVGALVIIAFAIAPESPVYLINHGQIEKARKVMNLIYSKDMEVDARLAHLVKTIREEKENCKIEAGTYFDCFKGHDLKRTLTVIFLYTSANFGGAAFLSQSIYFLIIVGLPAIHAFDISIGGFGLACIIIASSWSLNDRITRRTGFLTGTIINFLMMLTVGCLYYKSGTGALWAIAVLMNVDISLQTSLMQGMGWPIAAELSSYRLRGKTMSIAIIAQTLSTWVNNFCVPYMYNVDAGNLGARTGFVYAGMTLLIILGGFFLVPDTTDMTTEEIDHAYAKGLPARKINKNAVECTEHLHTVG